MYPMHPKREKMMKNGNKLSFKCVTWIGWVDLKTRVPLTDEDNDD